MKKHQLIFIADDDPIILKLIESQMKALKFDVMSFGYGEELLSELILKPDLIILDFIFVKGDEKVLGGLEILQKIRAVNADVPVVILSGQDSGSAVLELIKLGIEEYIIKDENFTTRLKDTVTGILLEK